MRRLLKTKPLRFRHHELRQSQPSPFFARCRHARCTARAGIDWVSPLCGCGNGTRGATEAHGFPRLWVGRDGGNVAAGCEELGADYRLPPGLAPLARHKADFSVVQGLSNKFANEAHWGSTFWLTGANRFAEPGQSFHNSISADQVAAGALGVDTRFTSLQLGCPDPVANGHGPGLSLAWGQRGKPMAGFDNPVLAYHRLFSDETMPLAQRQAMLAEKRSVLDAVLVDAKRVQRGLNKTDNDKLDEYFQSVRDIETRLGKDEKWLDVRRRRCRSPSQSQASRARRDQADV